MKKFLLRLTSLVFLLFSLVCFSACTEIQGLALDTESGYYCKVKVVNSDGKRETNEIIVEQFKNILRTKGYENTKVKWLDEDIEIKILGDDLIESEVYENLLELCKNEPLTFRAFDNTILLRGETCVEDARAGYAPEGNAIVVLQFTQNGQETFATATEKVSASEDKILNIYMGDSLMCSPTVNEKIYSSQAQIAYFSSIDEADYIAAKILLSIHYVEVEIEEFVKVD